VTSTSTHSELIASLEKRYGGLRSFDAEDALGQLLLIVLADGAAGKKALQALEALQEYYVDYNEIRVSSVHEIASVIAAVGPKNVAAKAKRLRDVLATVYSRFNRMSLAFLTDPQDKTAPRKTERLMGYLNELSPAYVAIFELYLAGRQPAIQATGGLPRVLGRLGLMKKGTGAAQLKKKLESEIGSDDWLVFVWGVHQVSETHCQRTTLLCAECCLREGCETAPEELARQEIARQKELERLTKDAARETARRQKEERERTKLEELEKKKAAAEHAKLERAEADRRRKDEAEKKKRDAARAAETRGKPKAETPARDKTGKGKKSKKTKAAGGPKRPKRAAKPKAPRKKDAKKAKR
jgi:endonuclease III